MIKHTAVNRILSALNILVALYILLTPLFPNLLFWWQQKNSSPPVILTQAAESNTEKPPAPTDNRVVIPSIHLNEPINEGPTASTLEKGVWRRPNTSVPSVRNNTVLAGHVYTYDNPAGVFYNLSKMTVGGEVAVYWENAEYLYEVTDIKEVAADAIEVEAPTDEAQLTLYTCTPIWNPVNRLVVTAKLTKATAL